MENPFKGMPKWGIYATIAGGVLVFGYAEYKHHEDTGSWSPFATSTTSSTTTATSTTTDPVTGLPYSEDSTVDPITGLEYLSEAEEYGSVAAAEADVSSFGGTEATGSGVPVTGTVSESDQASANTVVGSNVYTSNSAWAQAVQAGLEDVSGSTSYDGTDIGTAIGDYLTGTPVTAAQASVINIALAEYGPPPVGTFQIIQAPATTTGTTSTASETSKASTTAPADLRAVPSTTSVKLTWQNPSGVPTTLGSEAWTAEVYEGSKLISSKVVETPSADFTGLKTKTSYTAKVRWNDPKSPYATTSFKTT